MFNLFLGTLGVALLIYTILIVSELIKSQKYKRIIQNTFPLDDTDQVLDISTINEIITWHLTKGDIRQFDGKSTYWDLNHLENLRNIKKRIIENNFIDKEDKSKLNEIFR